MGASESTTATADAAPAQPEPAQPAKTEGGGGRTYRSMFRSNELQGKKDSLSRDVCIVFSRASTTVGPDASAEQLAEVEKLRDRRNDIFSRLRAAGLDLRVRQGSGEGFQDKVFVLVGAPEDKLEVMANKIGLEKALKPEFADKTVPIENHTGYAEYSTDTRELFQPGPDTFFTSLERQRMVYRMMEDRPAAVDLDRLVVDRVFDDYFSLPSQRRKLHLIHTWVDASLFTPAPINDIRDYYGEKIAFYFAWLQLYTVWLGWVSVISLLFLVVQAVWGVLRRTTDNPGLPAYAIIIVIATVVFTELWKRRQSVLAFTWNVQDFEEEEPPRPEFLRAKRIQEEPGVYNARGFVAISEDELKNAPRVLVFPYWEHLKRLTVGILATALMIASALVGTLLIMALKLALTEAWREQDGFEAAGGGENAAAIVAATVNGVFITVMNYVWAWVSVRLNAWETHRTDTQYEDSLIIKTFAFQFINSYISLFYIAYIQAGGLPLFGFKDESGELLFDSCPPGGCMDLLFIQLALLVTSKQVSRFVFSLGPALYSKYRFMQLKRGYFSDGKVTQLQMVQLESTLSHYPGTFEEYSEMAIQFGYVTLFAAAFPLGAVICWASNLAERKSDAAKLVHLSRRPRYRGAEDIGTWEHIFELISKISVITNALILIFTSNFTSGTLVGAFGSKQSAIIFLIIIEHVVFAAQALIAFLVPDTPYWVDAAKTRHDIFLEQKTKIADRQRELQQQEAYTLIRVDSDADDGSDSDDEATWQPPGAGEPIAPAGSGAPTRV